jgi:uncharacterized protein (TIGR02588 family)
MKVPEKNRLEWIVFAASVTTVAAVVGSLVLFEITRPDTPPELHVRVTGSRAAGDGFAVTVEVENRGGKTASDVAVEVERLQSGAEPERRELQLPYVPHGGVRSGEVVFMTDPPAASLRARVLSYHTPQ